MRLTSKERIENSHEDGIWTSTWTPANTLITGSVDETVKVWSPSEGNDSLHTYTGKLTILSSFMCIDQFLCIELPDLNCAWRVE